MALDSQKMRIAQIGNKFKSVEKISYMSYQTFMDTDVLIIDLPELVKGFDNNNYHRSNHFFEKRKDALREFLKYKNIPLIFFTPNPADFVIQQRKYGYSYFLPIEEFTLEAEQGKGFCILPNTIFTDFIRKYKENFKYNSFFSTRNGQTIADTLHTKKVLAFYNDAAIFIPELDHGYAIKEDEFLTDLVEVAKKVRYQNKKSTVPVWCDNFFLPKEYSLKIKVKEINNEIERLKNELAETSKELEYHVNKKAVFTATGDELENELEKIFKELGFEILEKEANRDDLVVKFREVVAVVEIKGVNGSSAEKHAAQLEKWVLNYYDINDIKPKGILLVNSYRDIELPSRTEPTFPHQMLKFSTQREHCLITTVQLLGLYYYIQSNPEKKEQVIQSMLETIGVYKDFEDWRTFIDCPTPQL